MKKLLLLILLILPGIMPAVDLNKSEKPLLEKDITLCIIRDITWDGLYAKSRIFMVFSRQYIGYCNRTNTLLTIPGIYKITIDYITEFMVKNYLVEIL